MRGGRKLFFGGGILWCLSPPPEFPPPRFCHSLTTGRPRFGSVRLQFGDGTVQAVPVFGSGGSSAKRVFCVSAQFNTKDGSGFGS